MSMFLFPDNTVLVNFASVERLDLLEAVLDGNGRWCEAVASEAKTSAGWSPSLASIPEQGWLGDPIEISDPIDVAQVDALRRNVFGGSIKIARQHLGEAQTCHVIDRWEDLKGSKWISDDRDSLEYARSKFIAVLETRDIVSQAVQLGKMTQHLGYALIEQMRALGHHPQLPASPQHL